jgi:CheY-like chemotaxis protein
MEQKYTILVVINESLNVFLYTKLLESRGYNVLVAESGEESLQIMEVIVPDLVLLDPQIPGKDGFEVMAEMKKNPLMKTVPVIIVTLLDDRSSKEKAHQLGAFEYYTIPVHANTILERIGVVLHDMQFHNIAVTPGHNNNK